MLLAIDIGNSNITLGGIQEGEILFEARLATDSTKTSDEYGVEIKDMLDLFGARVEEIRDCIVASVVPPVFNSVRNGIVKLTGKEPMVVGPGIKTGINILLEDPGATGADLIAAAVAAVDTYPTPLTVVDMGTATTIAVIDDGNAFLGGAVLPGLRISAEALSSRASLLPGIQLERPRRAIGSNPFPAQSPAPSPPPRSRRYRPSPPPAPAGPGRRLSPGRASPPGSAPDSPSCFLHPFLIGRRHLVPDGLHLVLIGLVRQLLFQLRNLGRWVGFRVLRCKVYSHHWNAPFSNFT